MKQGLLWYDSDPRRSLEEKVTQAAERYYQKFGHRADTCYVNPGMLGGTAVLAGEVRVVPARNILMHHLWVGVAAREAELEKVAM